MPTTPHPIRAWLYAVRPRTLPIGILPVLVGSILAFAQQKFSLHVLIATLVATLCLQIATNLINDASDFERGADDAATRLGPARTASMGWLRPRQLRTGVGVVMSIALIAGAWLVTQGGWPIACIGVVSALAAVLYTAGPCPLAYYGLGEIVAFVFFGPVALCGTYYLHTETVSPHAMLAGLALGCYAAAILGINNLRDIHTDAIAGKKTLAVRLGEKFHRFLIAQWLATPLVIAMILILHDRMWTWALPLILVVPTVRLIQLINRSTGVQLNACFALCSYLLMRFALLLSAGAVL